MGLVDNLMIHPATITRKGRTGAPDAHGVPMTEEGTSTSTVCYLSQGGVLGSQRSEDTVGREAEELQYTVFFPATVEVDGTDVVTTDGVTFEVVGPPWYARNPLDDTVDHIEANLRVITG